jgi:rhodanese-related sulfurtransferase
MSDVPLEVDVSTVRDILANGEDFVLLDCREPAEADIAAIRGAVLIPMGQIPMAADRLKTMDGKRIIVHCHHGGRSLRVANWLRSNGHRDAQSMAGGIDAWSLEIDQTVPRY